MPPEPLIIGFDTSAAHCAVALLSGGHVLVSRIEEMHKGQAEYLFPMMEQMLAEIGKNWADIAAIGVGVGPGNFTGIRLSVSAARGLALSLNIPAIGVSGFEAMAEGVTRPVLASIDARRDEVYLQLLDGSCAGGPLIANPDDIPAAFHRPDIACVGHKNTQIAQSVGGQASSPAFPLPVAITRIAARRMDQPNPRPAPLYIKSADAAPSRDAAPVILP